VCRRGAIPLAVLLVLLGGVAECQVRYRISLADREHHLVRVRVEFPPGSDVRELQLPVWNALYQVRDFSQYMNSLRATDTSGHALPLAAVNPSRWRLTCTAQGARLDYEMFSDNPDPYGAQLNSHHAFFNLAEILIYADDTRNTPALIEFEGVPAGWKIATPLTPEGPAYGAPTYDRLVDSPVEISDFAESDFSASCGKYRVILDQDRTVRNDAADQTVLQRIIPRLQRIANAASEWMNDCPFQTYMFIYHVSGAPGGGGMEHAYATAIRLPERDFNEDIPRLDGISAHEFFHLWNVKRIRPQSLEPVDYTRENYTSALWFSESVDSTASQSILLHAGLLDEKHYLQHLGEEITELENRPAHLRQSVEDSSRDAWLEKYPAYGAPARSISYYNKGELIGVLLDLAIRDATKDQSSIRELFRAMNQSYARQGRFFADSDAVRQAAETLTHTDLRQFVSDYVSGVAEIPWDNFFAPVGLRVVKKEVTFADPGFEAVQKFDGPVAVVQVTPGSEAERAGLQPDDILLEINGKTAGHDFAKQIAGLAPGTMLNLSITRRGGRHELRWKVGAVRQSVVQLQDVPDVSSQQMSRRQKWLFDRGPTP